VDIVVLQGEREMAKDNRMLGRFRLEGIPAAQRGVPQINVSFDIDANGILNVTAKDMSSGKEQTVTITESTNLDKTEVERMVQEAQQHVQEDKRYREAVDARNQADSLAYQLENVLKDLGDKVPVHEKSRCEQLIGDARKAVEDKTLSKERYQQISSDLQQALHLISSSAYQQAGTAEGAANTKTRQSTSEQGSDDVIDAEFTEN
jgi:molecular chaperone DnaK